MVWVGIIKEEQRETQPVMNPDEVKETALSFILLLRN